jgi:catechol 2,3-dioxygenase-like lactoylglutathione lyase family enzyme
MAVYAHVDGVNTVHAESLQVDKMKGAPVASWANGIGAITLFVEDLTQAKGFYSDVFGLPTAFEDEHSAVFAFGSTSVNLLSVKAAPELVEPARVGMPDSGSRAVVSVRWTTSTPSAPTSASVASSCSTARWTVRGASARPAFRIRPDTSGRS